MNCVGIEYECASCHGVFEADIEAFDGFVESVRLAAQMGREDRNGRTVVNVDKVPTVNACCPDCFQHIKP